MWKKLLALALLLAAPLKAQYRSVVVEDSVRAYLAAQWNDRDAYQPERGFCAKYVVYTGPEGAKLYSVVAVTPAMMRGATPYSSAFVCPSNSGPTVALHTHPPATCSVDALQRLDCRLGGNDAFLCFPSGADTRMLDGMGEPFNLIQCDRNAVVFYWPTKTVLKPPIDR